MNISILRVFVVLLLLTTVCAAEVAPGSTDAPAKAPDYWVYVGTFGNKGISLFRLDAAAGTLTAEGIAAVENDPNFLAAHPNGNVLYAVAAKGKEGLLDAFAIDRATGKLARLNQQATGGANAVYVSVDAAGKTAFVANYDGPSVASFAIKADGSLGEAATVPHVGSSVNPGRQKRAFPHSILPDPAGQFVFSPDLGCDKIFSYKLDAGKGTLAANDPAAFGVPAGAGPRHMAFHPTAPYAYIVTEMGNEVLACSYDAAKGTLKNIQATTIRPEGFGGWISGAEIKVHPSGKFLYASVRGANTIGVFAIDGASGKVSLVEHVSTRGKTPRGFNMDPSGAFLLAANQDSGTVSLFRIDAKTGKLTAAGEPAKVGGAVAAVFVPVAGK